MNQESWHENLAKEGLRNCKPGVKIVLLGALPRESCWENCWLTSKGMDVFWPRPGRISAPEQPCPNNNYSPAHVHRMFAEAICSSRGPFGGIPSSGTWAIPFVEGVSLGQKFLPWFLGFPPPPTHGSTHKRLSCGVTVPAEKQLIRRFKVGNNSAARVVVNWKAGAGFAGLTPKPPKTSPDRFPISSEPSTEGPHSRRTGFFPGPGPLVVPICPPCWKGFPCKISYQHER